MPEYSLRSDDRRKLVRYAAIILSGRPYFRIQLRDKLFAKAEKLSIEDPAEIIDSVLDDLASSGYLDDQYLADAYVRRQLSKCYGSKVIALKLKYLGLARELIVKSLASEAGTESELNSLKKYCQKNHRLEHRKLVSKLYSRGYSSPVIKKAFDWDELED